MLPAVLSTPRWSVYEPSISGLLFQLLAAGIPVVALPAAKLPDKRANVCVGPPLSASVVFRPMPATVSPVCEPVPSHVTLLDTPIRLYPPSVTVPDVC